MTILLSSLSACFQGVIPAIIATCSRDGEPNVTYLSQVHYLDEKRVALSCQFFNKTKKNVAENPYASVQLYDPVTFQAYQLELRFDHSETEGPLFEGMSARIDAIASHTGMTGIFRLISADVYEVLSVRRVEGFLLEAAEDGPKPLPPSDYRSEIRALQVLSDRVNRATDLEQLLASVLAALREEMGFEHAMVLLPDESGKKLFTVASSGYGESGVGAEVEVGKGLVGTVAAQRCVLRLSAVEREMRYGRGIRSEVSREGSKTLTPEIPLPGLPDAQSHLGIPLLVQDRLVGVLAVESRSSLGFHEWHEAFLNIVANQCAIAIERMVEREDEEPPAPPRVSLPPPSSLAAAPRTRSFRFYKGDDCVFVDGEYLIRNVPGRILWKILKSFEEEHRTEFTNRELRLDPDLGLPAIKDNLESRLILLRKRLEQKCPDVRIPKAARGHFRLELDCRIELVEKEAR